MSVRRLLAAALLVGLAVASPNADELPTRIFHIVAEGDAGGGGG